MIKVNQIRQWKEDGGRTFIITNIKASHKASIMYLDDDGDNHDRCLLKKIRNLSILLSE
jgi:hypothetical protein